MMVYLAMMSVDEYDPPDIVGVFSSRELAQDGIEKYIENAPYPLESMIEEYEVDKPDA